MSDFRKDADVVWPVPRQDVERAREVAEWLHHLLCAAQNLPWEEGDCCDDCLAQVNEKFPALLNSVRLEEARWWREQTHEGAICSPQDCTQCARVASLASLEGEQQHGKAKG